MRLYLALFGALAVAALVGWGFLERSRAEGWRASAVAAEAEQARLAKDLELAVAVNVGNRKTIDQMTAQRLANEKIVEQLADSVAAINAAATDLTGEVNKLGQTNETVKNYLLTPIPDDLRRLYRKP